MAKTSKNSPPRTVDLVPSTLGTLFIMGLLIQPFGLPIGGMIWFVAAPLTFITAVIGVITHAQGRWLKLDIAWIILLIAALAWITIGNYQFCGPNPLCSAGSYFYTFN